MTKPIIGINLPEVHAEDIEKVVHQLTENGYDAIEYCLSDHPLIVGGEINQEYVQYVRNIFRRYPVRFTAHIGEGLDLRAEKDFDLHKRVLFASIDICANMGLSPLTVHFEQATPYLQREERFFESHMEAADYAEQRGVRLCIENIEVEHYAKVLSFIRRANHPNLCMTLDIGHLNLAAHHFGHPFLDAVRECQPYVRHLHLSDNVGIFESMRLTNFDLYRTLPLGSRFALGRGDIHMPPYWGNIPIDEVLSILIRKGYDGIYICEYYNERFVPFNGSIQKTVSTAVQRIMEGYYN